MRPGDDSNAIWGWIAAGVVLSLFALFLFRSAPAHPQFTLAMAQRATVYVSGVTGHGSGVYLGGARIVTAAHVVRMGGAVLGGTMKVAPSENLAAALDATVVKVDEKLDYALLHVPPEQAAKVFVAARGTCEDPPIDAPVVGIGFPLNYGKTVTRGRAVTDKRERAYWPVSIVITSPVQPGSSGGPVFDALWRAWGIATGLRDQFTLVVPFSAACADIVPPDHRIPPVKRGRLD